MFHFVNDRTLNFLHKTEEIGKLFCYFFRFPIFTVKQLVPFFAMKMEVGPLKRKICLPPSNRLVMLDKYEHRCDKKRKSELTTVDSYGYPRGIVNYNTNDVLRKQQNRVVFQSTRRIKSFFPYRDRLSRG